MKQITLRIDEDLLDRLEAEADDRGVSRSEHIRKLLEDVDELQERVEDLERDVDRLTRERRHLLEQREEHQELVRYVDEERSWRDAGLTTRAKWWLFGKG